jgi:hypothetical protein
MFWAAFFFSAAGKRLYPIAKTFVVTASLLSEVTSALIDRYISVERHHASRDNVASVGGIFHAVADQFEDSLKCGAVTAILAVRPTDSPQDRH